MGKIRIQREKSVVFDTLNKVWGDSSGPGVQFLPSSVVYKDLWAENTLVWPQEASQRPSVVEAAAPSLQRSKGGRLKVASRSSSRARINVQDVLTPKSQLLKSPLTWNNVVANTALLLLYSLDHQWLRDTGGWAVTVWNGETSWFVFPGCMQVKGPRWTNTYF